MNLRKMMQWSLVALASAVTVPMMAACGGSKNSTADSAQSDSAGQRKGPGGPQLGKPGGGMAIDKSDDSTLQALVKEVVPKFKQLQYKDASTGITMTYNLYTPENLEAGKKYPLVLFMADASTPGSDVSLPLRQGYGALVFAAPEWQKEHPCYVLVPQFSGVAVNDAYEHTDEGDVVARMTTDVAAANAVDTNRLYTTGQSMGGMISMYFNAQYPDLFAASIFVDCHWDTAVFPELSKHKFIYFIAGDKGHAYQDLKPLEEACEKNGVQYTFAEWSAKLPETRQSELASTMLAKGAPVNIFMFETGSVLPESGKGSEHMYSFDYAYKVTAAREWLFRQAK